MIKNRTNIKNILLGTTAVAVGMLLSGCKDDFLNRTPKDKIGPDTYYNTAEQLSTFTINKYAVVFPGIGGYNAGVANWDNGTDNQANVAGNEGMFTNERWEVSAGGGIGFNEIRNLNKFITEMEAKNAAGKISGSKAQIDHYMGEAYTIRAMLYYQKLRDYGDYPIIDKVLNVDDDLVDSSKRQPRNEVARHILKDLDKAISLLQNTTNRNQRISKRAALVLKSRVALYEATFEKYHKGSGRIPGDANWPGKNKEWNKSKTFDQAGEVDFFLTQAMEAAKTVADQIPLTTINSHVMNPTDKSKYSGWNPYYDMYASKDLSKFPEIILWEEFNTGINKAHMTSTYLAVGGNNGWTRGLVESFLMKNGLPIYAANSGYKGDKSIDLAKTERDERLQLFLFGETTLLSNEKEGMKEFGTPGLVNLQENRDVTGYRQRKFYNYDPKTNIGTSFQDESGLIQIRVEEAYLNYMEASYLKNGNLDETAKKYWTALRKRAGIDAPISVTIDATDMGYEADLTRNSYDWGAFSAGAPIDKTLYSIRRERRNELAGEGYRMDDLKRWRAMDQVKNYQIEGVNLWDEMYKSKGFLPKDKDGNIKPDATNPLLGEGSDGGEKALVSSKELTKYVRPYQIRKNNIFYKNNGYTFYEAHYLSPFSLEEMLLTSPTKKVEESNLYQNIYWPTYVGKALK